MSQFRLGSRPTLDGIRAVAITAVVGYHYIGTHGLIGGWVGVDLFFVLSGFLITSLLLEEVERTGSVSLSSFWTRRQLRLAPALIAPLAGYALFTALAPPARDMTDAAISHPIAFAWFVSAVTYVINWPLATGHVTVAGMAHLWSLAVEGQFYIFWPLIVIAATRARPTDVPRAVRIAAVALIVVSTLFVIVVLVGWGATADNRFFLYRATPSRLSGMLAGAALAASWKIRGPRPNWTAGRGAQLLVVASTAVLAYVAVRVDANSPILYPVGLLAIAAASTVVIAAAAEATGMVGRLLSLPPVLWVGRRSYAIYIWHLLVVGWLRDVHSGLAVKSLVCTLVAAELSFRLVESPVLALRSRLSARSAA